MDRLGFRLRYRFTQDPRSSPRLFTAFHVPLTTWLRHPSAGVDCYEEPGVGLEDKTETGCGEPP